MAIDPTLQTLLLLGAGYVTSELSAVVRFRRVRRANLEDRNREAEALELERLRDQREAELLVCIDLLTECHSIAIHVDGARERAHRAVTHLRLVANPDLALAGSKHYVAASTGSSQEYQVSQVAFINESREHFGQNAIQSFVGYMDGGTVLGQDD